MTACEVQRLPQVGGRLLGVTSQGPYEAPSVQCKTPSAQVTFRLGQAQSVVRLSDDAIDAFLSRGDHDQAADPQQLPYGSFQDYGGAIAAKSDDECAFSHRNTLVEFVASTAWTDPAQDEERITGARRYGVALEPFATGVYVNVLSDEGEAGVRRAYPPNKLARLAALKRRYDPDNVFHLNQNIRPDASTK